MSALFEQTEASSAAAVCLDGFQFSTLLLAFLSTCLPVAPNAQASQSLPYGRRSWPMQGRERGPSDAEDVCRRAARLETKSTSLRLTSVNLINSFVGAGLMALPHAFAGLGFYAGMFVLVSVSLAMYHSMLTIIKCADDSEHSSLTCIVHERLGIVMARVVQACILFNNFGVLVLYLVVMADTLVGTPTDDYDGFLPNLVGDHSGDAWFLSRWFVTLVLCVFCIQPLVLKRFDRLGSTANQIALSLRRLGSLTRTSIVAVVLVTAMAFFCAGLAMMTTIDSEVDMPVMGPDSSVKEQDIVSNCSLNLIVQGFSVYVFAFIGHYNIPPLMGEMEGCAGARMTTALRHAVGFSAGIYTIVPISCWIVFGGRIDDDILKNLGAHSLSSLMPELASQLTSYAVSVGYTVILLCIYPMDNFALRQNLSSLCFSTTRPVGWKFYFVTYLLLLGAYVCALSVGSVFLIVNFVGCTACSILGLILPGLLSRQGNPKQSSIACAMILSGILLILHGTLGQAWRLMTERPIYCAFQ